MTNAFFRMIAMPAALALGLAAPAALGADQTGSVKSTTDQLGQLARANRLIGKEVATANRQTIGKLRNLVVDLESGRVLYVAVAGQSGKTVAVPSSLVKDYSGEQLVLNTSLEQLRNAPVVSDAMVKDSGLGQASFVSQVYKHFGQTEWWQGSAPTDQGKFHNVHHVKQLVGMDVKDVSDREIGQVNNVIVDLPAGRVVYVIFEPDNNLNLGKNLYALPPDALTLGKDGKHLVSNLSKEKLASAPHFPSDKWPNISSQAYASQVYKYYGKQAYFEGPNALTPTGRTEASDSSGNSSAGWDDFDNGGQDWRDRERDRERKDRRDRQDRQESDNSF